MALCKRDSCKQEPAIMHRVLSFLAAPGFDMPLYSPIVLHCVANGCRAQTVAVTSFFTMCDNFIRMSGRWQVAGRLSGQFARRPSACFEKKVQRASALVQSLTLTLQLIVEATLRHTATLSQTQPKTKEKKHMPEQTKSGHRQNKNKQRRRQQQNHKRTCLNRNDVSKTACTLSVRLVRVCAYLARFDCVRVRSLPDKSYNASNWLPVRVSPRMCL